MLTIHHGFQAAVGLAAIGGVILGTGLGWASFGFQKKGFRESIRPIVLFLCVFAVVQTSGTLLYVYPFTSSSG